MVDETAHEPSAEANQLSLIRISNEGWRLAKFLERTLRSLDGEQQRRIVSRLEFFVKVLQEELATNGLKFVEFTGSTYTPQLPVTALNADEFGAEDTLVITQQLEPVIIGDSGVIRRGTVIVDRSSQ